MFPRYISGSEEEDDLSSPRDDDSLVPDEEKDSSETDNDDETWQMEEEDSSGSDDLESLAEIDDSDVAEDEKAEDENYDVLTRPLMVFEHSPELQLLLSDDEQQVLQYVMHNLEEDPTDTLENMTLYDYLHPT